MKALVDRWVATREGFKPRDVEEPIDYYWHRPVAGLLVDVLAPTAITPNQMTLLSGVASASAGAALCAGAWGASWWGAVAGLLLFVSITFDCADGQLARIRGTSTMLGRILDGATDFVAPLSVFLGMAAYLLMHGFPHAWVWPMGVAAAASLAWHASDYDVNKNIYLHATRPDFSLGGNTLLTLDDMRDERERYRAEGDGSAAFLMNVWIVWSAPQVKAMGPWVDPSRSPRNEAEQALFKQHFRPQMRALTWIGFGSHLFILTLSCLLAPLDPRAILVGWIIIAGPMNAIALYATLGRNRRIARYREELAALRGLPA